MSATRPATEGGRRLAALLGAGLKSREGAGVALRTGSVGMQYLVSLIVARALGASDYGAYAYALSWLMMLSTIQRFGLAQLIVREISTYLSTRQDALRNGAMVRAWQATGVLIVLAVAAAGIVAALWSARMGHRTLILYGVLLLPFMGMTGTFEALTRATGRMIAGQLGEFGVRYAANLVLVAVLLTGVLGVGLDGRSALGAAALSGAMAMLLAGAISVASIKVVPGAGRATDDRRWGKSLATLTLISLVSSGNAYAPLLLAGLFLQSEQIAFFQVALQTSALLGLGLSVANSVQAADFARLHASEDHAALQTLATHGSRVAFAFALAAAVSFAALGRPFLTLAFGRQFASAYIPLLILCLGQLASAATGSVGTILNSIHRERDVFHAMLAATAALALLTVPAVRLWGVSGAASVAASSVALWNWISTVLLYRRTGIVSLPFAPRRVAKPS